MVNQEALVGRAWMALQKVPDPEMPALSITELGIVRDVAFDDDLLTVTITPTYSGCPALAMIETSIRDSLADLDVGRVAVKTVLSPAWTSDWIGPEAKLKLVAEGIAAPHAVALMGGRSQPRVACPRCASMRTGLITQFSGTACKALYRCLDCLEPFDYFKPH
jgi:ring-1,2-phenylacetyl-CoA epoxidase subunit PaaD